MQFLNATDMSAVVEYAILPNALDRNGIGCNNAIEFYISPYAVSNSVEEQLAGVKELLTISERILLGFEALCVGLTRKEPVMKKTTKWGKYGAKARFRDDSLAFDKTQKFGKTFGRIAKVLAFAALGIEIGLSWYSNYKSGSETWVSDSVIDSLYIGARFGVSALIVYGFSFIPFVGWLIGIGVAIGVDYLIRWAMESGALDALKVWASDVGQSMFTGWNNFTTNVNNGWNNFVNGWNNFWSFGWI